MSTDPVRDAATLETEERSEEQRLVDDFVAAMERALAKRKRLKFEPVEWTEFLPDGRSFRKFLKYRNSSGDVELTAEEYDRSREEFERELREIDRDLLPVAREARLRGSALFERFRRGNRPNGPHPVGAYTANSVRSEDGWWEYAATWGERLRDGTYDRAIAAQQIQRSFRELRETYGAFDRAVPDTDTIAHALVPTMPKKRARTLNSILDAFYQLTGVTRDTTKAAVARANEQANHVPVVDDDGQIRMVVLDREKWVGATIQLERRRSMSWPQEFSASADDPPLNPPMPEDWADDTVEQRWRRFQDYKWEGSRLVPRVSTEAGDPSVSTSRER